MKFNKKRIWRGCVIAVLAITVYTYFGLVPESSKIEPDFLGIPFVLWHSMVLTLLIVVLTYVGGKTLPENEEDVL